MPGPAVRPAANSPIPLVFGGNWIPEGIQYYDPSSAVSWAGTTFGIGTVQVSPLIVVDQMAITAVDCFVSQTYSATNAGSSQNISLSLSVGIYSNQAGTLQQVASGSISNVASVTGSTSSVSFNGIKNIPVPLSANLYQGNYWVAIASSSASTGNAIAAGLSNVVISVAGGISNYSGVYGQNSNATNQVQFGLGNFSSSSSVLPSSMPFSSIIGSGVGNTAFPVYHLKAQSA